MDRMDKDSLYALNRIARDAGAAIMEIYARDFEVMTKQDQSPLTEADLASHQCIINALAEHFPDIPVLSEESKGIDYEQRRDWERFFLIDPLDGTKEFVKRNGEFTVNIALIEDGRPVAGVVFAPVPDTLWFAADELGAWRSQNGGEAKPIAAGRFESLSGLRIVGSRSHPSTSMQAFLDELPEHELLAMGSSIKLCAVADSGADVYPRLGPTSEWDTAAAHCVVEQAGGSVVRLDGEPLAYNKEDILNPLFMVLGNCPSEIKDILTASAREKVEFA